MNKPERKLKFYNLLKEVIKLKILDAENAIAELQHSRNDSTKSSAGDKHETGRAMMQIELDKSLAQLEVANHHMSELLAIDPGKTSERVRQGSLVVTNFESYFISIGTGKMEINDEIVYAISSYSPLGSQLLNKKVDDSFSFLDRDFIIKEIV